MMDIARHAELDLVICSGQVTGKQQTYALVEHRAPGAKSLSRDEPLAELTRRYSRVTAVHLLQGYDEYIIACSESKDVYDVARLRQLSA